MPDRIPKSSKLKAIPRCDIAIIKAGCTGGRTRMLALKKAGTKDKRE